METELVKENVRVSAPLGARWLAAAAAATALALAAVARLDSALPPPRDRSAPNDSFIAEIALEHLVNLTSMGPRVAGSYENEVLAVAVVSEALRGVARAASRHNRLDVDLHSSAGAFPLTFLDGMNNVYYGVQSVVARLSGAGSTHGPALLINCHFDSVPDSPGASDDAAGCAVGLEVLRALAAAERPLRRDVLLLLNGAEENIMQASHSFITTHRWARQVRAFINIEACGAGGREVLFQAGPHDPWIMEVGTVVAGCVGCTRRWARQVRAFINIEACGAGGREVLFQAGPHDPWIMEVGTVAAGCVGCTCRWARQVRAFINIEACGAGGREVLFQAGPHDPWIMEVYAGAVPRPFASSLAQELFESGLIPGDTDFRVFRDFGNLSGVDLAWSANGYVYHTRLDAWQSVPAAALQRTGDNVLALARGLVEHPAMDARAELAPQPVFFDVLGLGVVCARGHAAAAAAAATLALVALRVHLNARDASKQLYMVAGAWWALALRGLVAGAAGAGGGLAAAGAAAALLHAAGRSLPYYTSTWLLVPLYALPALCCGCWCTAAGWRRAAAGAPLVRGWWAARLAADALALGWALLLGGAAAARLRSGYVPLLPALLPTAADLAASLAGLSPGARAACWAGGWALPVLQLWYLTLACLAMFVPLAGRAGSPPAPADVAVALLAAALTMAPASWLMPLYLVTRGRHRLMCGLALWSAAVLALVLLGALGEPYSAARPQRLMLFHTRRTDHAANTTDTLYWAPHIDANTRQSLDKYVSPLVGGAPAVEMSAAECARHVYCGAPYFLPARGLIRRGYWLPAPGDAPLARLHAGVALQRHNRTHHTVTIHVTDGGAHVMVLVSPTGGGEVARYWAAGAGGGPPVQALRWGARRTYCCMLHQRQPAAYSLQLDLVHKEGAPAEGVAALSVAAHAMFGARMRTPAHAALLARLPPAVAATGWGVDLHLYHV